MNVFQSVCILYIVFMKEKYIKKTNGDNLKKVSNEQTHQRFLRHKHQRRGLMRKEEAVVVCSASLVGRIGQLLVFVLTNKRGSGR